MKPGARKALGAAARLLLAALLLFLVLRQVHWHDYPGPAGVRPGLLTMIAQADGLLLGAAMACVMGSVLVSALRLRLMLGVQGIPVGVGGIFKLAVMAEFFDTLIPGAFGGDVAKAWLLARDRAGKAQPVIAVLADRFVGLMGRTLLAASVLAAAGFAGAAADRSLWLPAASLLAVVLLIGGALVFLFKPAVRRALRLEALYPHLPLGRHLDDARAALRALARPGAYLGRALLLTAASNILSVSAVALLGRALALPVASYHYFICIPLMDIVAAVPLTPGGLGVTEQLYVLYLGPLCELSGIVALALLVRGTAFCSGLLGFGFVLWNFSGLRRAPAA